MVGEGIQTPERRALVACQQYMGQGAAVEIAGIPVLDIQSWASDVENVRLESHHAYTAGWLETEAALTTFRHDPNGLGNPHYAPTVLLERAQNRWQGIYLDQKSTPELRSKAQVARGSLELYELLVTGRDVLRHKVFWDNQIEGATTLLKSYDRRKDPLLTHELHIQTLMLLMGTYLSESNLLATPAPCRFQESDSERRYDMILWRLLPDGYRTHRMLMAAQEGGAFAGNVVVSPSTLSNEGYEPRLGHGTLRALLETIQDKKPREMFQRKRHLNATFGDLLGNINEQVFNERGLILGVDPESGLDAARGWYENLEPNYRFVAQDKSALEECINAHEYALGGEDQKPEDIYRLGWLWAELASLPGGSDGYDRAIQVFELAAQTAVDQEDWPVYVESMLGVATAKLRNAISGEGPASLEHVQAYREDLIEVGEGMLNGFANIEADSPHMDALQRALRRLTICLTINTDPDLDYLATFPSPRQRITHGKHLGSDLHVLPLVGDTYNMHAAGRLRFADTETNTLDKGVATVALAKLEMTSWQEELSLLQSIVSAFRTAEWSNAEARIPCHSMSESRVLGYICSIKRR